MQLSISYHDGQSEVVNKCLETYLHCYPQDTQRTWTEYLLWVELGYNTSRHFATGITPFEAVYENPPPDNRCYQPGSAREPEVNLLLRCRGLIIKELKHHLIASRNQMMRQYNRRHRGLQFAEGNWVFLQPSPPPCKEPVIDFHDATNKFASCYIGPYQVKRSPCL